VSSLRSGKLRHPMRNSRLLCLVRRLSFTTSTKYCGLSLLDASNMFTLVCITVDFAPVELSPTHCPRTDVDVSLKDFPPASSEVVLLLLPLSPSPVFVFSFLFFILHKEWKKNSKKKIKSSQILGNRDRGGNRSTHYPGKWIVSVRVRTDHPVQPLLYLSISKPYQLSSTDPPVSTVGFDSTMVLSTVG
jgi:hypothetical protein